MIFAFICFDEPGSRELRQKVRAEHIEYMLEVKDITVFGGPLLDDDGVTSVGSIFGISFDAREKAEDFIANEPYTREGLFASIEIFQWRQMVPEQSEGALLYELAQQKKLAM